MPLDVKPLPPVADVDEEVLKTEDHLAHFIRTEVDRAVRDVERGKRLADAELDQRTRRASKRIVSAGHRLERSLRAPPFPIVPISIGLAIVGLTLLLTRRN